MWVRPFSARHNSTPSALLELKLRSFSMPSSFQTSFSFVIKSNLNDFGFPHVTVDLMNHAQSLFSYSWSVPRREVANAKSRMSKNYMDLISMGWVIWRIVDGWKDQLWAQYGTHMLYVLSLFECYFRYLTSKRQTGVFLATLTCLGCQPMPDVQPVS